MTLPVSHRLDFSEIPIIDIGPLIDGRDIDATVSNLASACTDVGFFYIKNHGVDPALIDRLIEQAKLFFDQPMEDKTRIIIDRCIRGYLPLYYRSYESEERAGTSHQEGFWIGHETPLDADRPLDGANQWPAYPDQLQSIMLEYFATIEALSHVLQRGFALALGLESDYFSPLFERPTSRLKLNHYPPQLNPQSENNIGVVPHSDSGAFTILWQDQHGGLEIQSKNGDWVGAPPIDDTFVVNIGNIMQRWSNGRFSSTPHRVINRYSNDRYSIPLFVNPDHETIIEPLVDQSAVLFEPFNYGDYQLDLWRTTFPIANIP